jgi:hypothetical protein
MKLLFDENLSPKLPNRLVRRDIMQESVIYRSIQDEKTRAITSGGA